MTVLLVGLVFVVVLTVAYVVLRNAQDFSDANEIVPGVPTRAPKEWAGAHTPEARMHRRLRDAVGAARANSQLDAPDLADVRTAIEQEALAIDDTLIAVASLPTRRRAEPLRAAEHAVAALEDVVADVVSLRGPTPMALETGIRQIRTRLALVEEARSELAGMSGSFDVMRQQLDAPSREPEPPAGPSGGPAEIPPDPPVDPPPEDPAGP